MSVQAKWGPMSFVVSPSQIASISDLSTTYALKTDVNEDTLGKSSVNETGKELQPVNFKVTYLRAAGVDPRKNMEQWGALIGESYPLYLGGRVFGPSRLQLQIADVAAIRLSNSGDMISCDVMLSFMEYSSAASIKPTTITLSGSNKTTAVPSTPATPEQHDANIHADTSAYWTTNKSNANPDSSAYWSAQKDKAMQAKAAYKDKVEKKASAKTRDANITSSTSAYHTR